MQNFEFFKDLNEEEKETVIIDAESTHLFTNFSIVRNIPIKANELIKKWTTPECWNIYVKCVYSGDWFVYPISTPNRMNTILNIRT